MGILDDYFKGSEAAPSEVVPTQPSNVINQYMSDVTPSGLKKVYITPPAPPISDATPDQSAAINADIAARPVSASGPTVAPITDVPVNAGNAVYDAAKAGVLQMGQGAGQVLSNQPATGLGNIASGALSTLTSPIAGVEQVTGDVMGSKDIADRAGVVASVLPVAPATLSALNTGYKSLKTLSSPSTVISKDKAFKNLVEMIGPDNVGNVAKEMRADPRLTPADLSPAVKSATQKLFTIEGDVPKNHIANFVNDRASGAKEAVENAMDSSLGKTINPVEKIQELKNNIKKVGATQINPILKNTKPVDLTPVIEHIDNILKPGVNSVISNPENMLPYDRVQKTVQAYRDMLTNNKTVLTSPDVLNKLQSGMRRNGDSLLKSLDPEAKAEGYALHRLRQKIIDAIGKAGPQTVDKEGNAISAYRQGLNKYRDEYNVDSAYEEGHDSIISNSKKLLDRPEFFEKKVKDYTPEEKEAAQQGARLAIDTQINGFKSAARRGTDIGQVDFNKDRITSLFGKEEADKLFKKLENERKIAQSNSDFIGGSQTAMRKAGDSRVELPVRGESKGVAKYVVPALTTAGEIGGTLAGLPHGLGGGLGLLTSGAGVAVSAGASAAKFKIATALAKEHNAQLAKLALPTQGPDREALIKSLEAVARQPKRSLLTKVNSLARLVGP